MKRKDYITENKSIEHMDELITSLYNNGNDPLAVLSAFKTIFDSDPATLFKLKSFEPMISDWCVESDIRFVTQSKQTALVLLFEYMRYSPKRKLLLDIIDKTGMDEHSFIHYLRRNGNYVHHPDEWPFGVQEWFFNDPKYIAAIYSQFLWVGNSPHNFDMHLIRNIRAMIDNYRIAHTLKAVPYFSNISLKGLMKQKTKLFMSVYPDEEENLNRLYYAVQREVVKRGL
jgi:hypothetical protein